MARGLCLALALSLVVASARADEPVPPTPAELARAIRRYVDAHGDPDVCRPTASVAGELRYECWRTECPGNCLVVRVTTILGYRAGRFRRVSRRRTDRGDTGECGCCLEDEL